MASLRGVLGAELDAIRAAGTWKAERVITSPQAASIRVRGRDGEVINFCANNYLGLSVSGAVEGRKAESGIAFFGSVGGGFGSRLRSTVCTYPLSFCALKNS